MNLTKTKFYIGTTEKIAKESPIKGIKDVILSDVYAPYFSYLQKETNWAIIELNIDIETLKLLPFIGNNLQKSLKNCGTCAYKGFLNPDKISKIVIYNKNTNPFITNWVIKSFDKTKHKVNYQKNYLISQWFWGYKLEDDLWEGCCECFRNRDGLELFYV